MFAEGDTGVPGDSNCNSTALFVRLCRAQESTQLLRKHTHIERVCVCLFATTAAMKRRASMCFGLQRQQAWRANVCTRQNPACECSQPLLACAAAWRNGLPQRQQGASAFASGNDQRVFALLCACCRQTATRIEKCLRAPSLQQQ